MVDSEELKNAAVLQTGRLPEIMNETVVVYLGEAMTKRASMAESTIRPNSSTEHA